MLIMILIMIIMNMQNKLYTIQSSHHPKTDSQSVPEQRSWNPKLVVFVDFAKLIKKTKHPEKFKLLDKRGFEDSSPRNRERERESCPLANPHS